MGLVETRLAVIPGAGRYVLSEVRSFKHLNISNKLVIRASLLTDAMQWMLTTEVLILNVSDTNYCCFIISI